ncbi:MAG TPA: bifunctional nuclease family protein [Deltaproteobacteria bacterium]|nr:bifunctional nuclease family protein [Candidatus Binatota bacterium]HIL13788.1 bifunctional nuclease family protein [Deltaproteobacteria bacterium]
MSADGFVRMSVGGLALDPVTKTPIVILRDEGGALNLPIWIGQLEATSMATELEGVKMTRPMTHDLLCVAIEKLGASVERIEVTEIRDGTFFAVIKLKAAGQQLTLDARPSDAISLALRTGTPIYVADGVIEATEASRSGQEEPVALEGERDLSDVSPDQWVDILENLDPDDFKYKM